MEYLCILALSLMGVKDQAEGWLQSQERQELQGEERGNSYCLL